MTAVMKPARLLVFWDYDTQWGWDRSRMKPRPASWGHLEFECTERLLELHAAYEVPACFAVVGAAALEGERPYHDPAQIRRIHGAKHEVASHSFRHEWLPGLSRVELLKTLRLSKEALEQCVGAPVKTFVPPWNQPFDYPGGWSFSLAERREAGAQRNDLRDVCVALGEAGYEFCRVAYRPLPTRLLAMALRRDFEPLGRLESISGITCVRLNSPGGFGQRSRSLLERCASAGGLLVVYGHPHALLGEHDQGERMLIPFLKRVQELCRAGSLRVSLPRDMERAA
ncbi:MAG: polysaccharide deacetylase family protein [Acidobacteriota bacterium]